MPFAGAFAHRLRANEALRGAAGCGTVYSKGVPRVQNRLPARATAPAPRRFPNLLRDRASRLAPTADPRAPAWSSPLAPLGEWLKDAQQLIDSQRR